MSQLLRRWPCASATAPCNLEAEFLAARKHIHPRQHTFMRLAGATRYRSHCGLEAPHSSSIKATTRPAAWDKPPDFAAGEMLASFERNALYVDSELPPLPPLMPAGRPQINHLSKGLGIASCDHTQQAPFASAFRSVPD